MVGIKRRGAVPLHITLSVCQHLLCLQRTINLKDVEETVSALIEETIPKRDCLDRAKSLKFSE
jgi:hypothetical protein